MARSRVGPLNWNVPIVNPDRTPTKEFMQKWILQAAINGDIPSLSTSAQVSAVLDVLGGNRGDILRRGIAQWGTLPSPSDATKFLSGGLDPSWAKVKDSDLALTDITTNDVTDAAHGFAPKLPNDATMYLDGTGAYTVPAGGGGGGGGYGVLLETASISSAASYTFDVAAATAAGYKVLVFELIDWIPASNGDGLRARMGQGSPPSLVTASSSYWWVLWRAFNGGTNLNEALDNHIEFNAGNGISNNAYGGISATIKMVNGGITTSATRIRTDTDHYADNGIMVRTMSAAQCRSVGATTSFNCYFGSGNISSGEIRMIGYT